MEHTFSRSSKPESWHSIRCRVCYMAEYLPLYEAIRLAQVRYRSDIRLVDEYGYQATSSHFCHYSRSPYKGTTTVCAFSSAPRVASVPYTKPAGWAMWHGVLPFSGLRQTKTINKMVPYTNAIMMASCSNVQTVFTLLISAEPAFCRIRGAGRTSYMIYDAGVHDAWFELLPLAVSMCT